VHTSPFRSRLLRTLGGRLAENIRGNPVAKEDEIDDERATKNRLVLLETARETLEEILPAPKEMRESEAHDRAGGTQ
jgi:hypothetical protein